MRLTDNKIYNYIVKTVLLSVIIGLTFVMPVVAGSNKSTPSVKLYESNAGFSLSDGNKVSALSYGKGIGSFYISGNISREASKDGMAAYPVDGQVTFGYQYNPGDYQTDVKENWNLVDSDEKTLDGVKLPKKVADGLFIVQKSSDGKTWVDACDPINDLFSSKKLDLTSLYSVSEEEIKTGTYFRVLVLYEMKRKIGTEKNWAHISTDVYEQKQFIEEYDFYLTYASNPLAVYDLVSRSPVTNNATVSDGFTIDNNGANTSILVKKDNGAAMSATPFESFYLPGTYTIKTTSPLGDEYENTIKVSNGLSTSTVEGLHYENPEKQEYTTVNGATGSNSLTSLMIGQKAGKTIKKSKVNGFDAFGITGEKVSLLLRVNKPQSGWEIITDDWGRKEKQTIDGIWAGTVATGSLIVQKSSDGNNWQKIEDGRYANGLYTSDFYNYYGGNGDVLVYSPDGKDVLNGIYIRVIYAYEIKNAEGKDKRRCIEEYKFYLCNDELGAVTFHNLTVQDQLKEIQFNSTSNSNDTEEDKPLTDQDSKSVKGIYEMTETMESGAVTVTGFSIDTSLNPTVTYTVKKNGVAINSPNQTRFTETGKYDIQLKSATGSEQNVTLYVDRLSNEDVFKLYFGDNFINGKRIYDSKALYPVYEGGLTEYNLIKIPDYYQPLYGTIINKNTGETKEINASRSGIHSDLLDEGEYEVVLNNNPTYKTETPSGDNRVITFHFFIIKNGTAPGPVLNQKYLEDYVQKSISGIYPKYYGVVRQSAWTGYILKAFSTREAARKDAYNFESGMVETLKDGTFLYADSNIVVPKARYDSIEDLTDDRNKAADESVFELYIDASDPTTYLTLQSSVLEQNDNLKVLELKNSVFIFGEGEESRLRKLDALPILNAVPKVYLLPGREGNTKVDPAEFEFIKDKYGSDSDSVKITDSKGNTYDMDYRKPVGKQLTDKGCATGVVTITETTCYGDSNTYEAVFFANGDNTAQVTLDCSQNNSKTNIVLDQTKDSENILVDYFSISKIVDELDPYSFAIVKDPTGSSSAYVADQSANIVWSDNGVYEIKVVNRIGNSYNFTVEVNNTEYATISFQGEGASDYKPIVKRTGDKNISLPTPDKYGYEFAGYIDGDGKMYEETIDQINFSGTKVLSPIWRAKKTKLIFENSEGEELETIMVDYGSEVDLSSLDILENYSNTIWQIKDGETITDNKLTINEENDITLVATTVVEMEDEAEKQEVANNDNAGHGLSIVIFLLIAGLFGGGIFFYRNKLKNIPDLIKDGKERIRSIVKNEKDSTDTTSDVEDHKHED